MASTTTMLIISPSVSNAGNLLSTVLGLDGPVPWAELQPHLAPDLVSGVLLMCA